MAHSCSDNRGPTVQDKLLWSIKAYESIKQVNNFNARLVLHRWFSHWGNNISPISIVDHETSHLPSAVTMHMPNNMDPYMIFYVEACISLLWLMLDNKVYERLIIPWGWVTGNKEFTIGDLNLIISNITFLTCSLWSSSSATLMSLTSCNISSNSWNIHSNSNTDAATTYHTAINNVLWRLSSISIFTIITNSNSNNLYT